MAKLPTIVIVQGAFQTPEFYRTFETRLEDAGFKVVHPVLPTCSNTDATNYGECGPADDSKTIRNQVQQLVEELGETVVIAMHSYGGVPTTNTNFEHLSIDGRRSRGLPGGLAQLIYFGSVAVPEGYSNHKANGGKHPADVELQPDGRYIYGPLAEKQFNELSAPDRDYWIAKTIPHTQKVFTYETSHAAWRYIPSTCIVLDKDLAIPAAVQEALATAAGAQIEHLDAGHGVALSDPGLLSQKICEIVKKNSL